LIKVGIHLTPPVPTSCGERYFHATTLDAIDRDVSLEHVVKDNWNVEVGNLDSVWVEKDNKIGCAIQHLLLSHAYDVMPGLCRSAVNDFSKR
jgi:hypothetical protein